MYLWYIVRVYHEEKKDFDLREGNLRGGVYVMWPMNVLGCQKQAGLGGLHYDLVTEARRVFSQ